MKKFSEDQNNGTLYYGPQVKSPAQGTWILENNDGSVVVAKGIVRPLLINPYTNQKEEEACCKEAAFKQNLSGSGSFYPLGKVGRNQCNFAYQTALFSAFDPVALINHDNKRFENKTALDFLSKESATKVRCGIPPNLLMDQMAPWDEFRRFDVNGVRATVYGSELVPLTSADAEEQMPKVHNIVLSGSLGQHKTSCFMLLPKSAEELAAQIGVLPNELIGRYFLIHRDPALPDGTSLYPAIYCGILKWDNEDNKNDYGVILNPQDPFWKDAGGDFDGDTAACYEPSEWLLPYGSIGRPDFKTSTRRYISEHVDEQIIELAGNTVTGLLGPIILSAMCLIERDINDSRSTLAGVAQASVQAKKHSVDIETVKLLSNTIFTEVKNAEICRPYISRYLNAIKNASGIELKITAWLSLVKQVERGTWSEGTKIEQAIANRVLLVHQLYKDVEYFRHYKEAIIPTVLRDTAKATCPEFVRSQIVELTRQYRDVASMLTEHGSYELDDEDLKEGNKAALSDRLKTIRTQFQLACITGKLPEGKASPKDIQIAMIAWGPAKLAAQLVPSSVYQELGVNTSRCIIQLCDHGWKNGVYSPKDLKPIPSCEHEFSLFTKGIDKVTVQIISEAKRSTRVMLTT